MAKTIVQQVYETAEFEWLADPELIVHSGAASPPFLCNDETCLSTIRATNEAFSSPLKIAIVGCGRSRLGTHLAKHLCEEFGRCSEVHQLDVSLEVVETMIERQRRNIDGGARVNGEGKCRCSISWERLDLTVDWSSQMNSNAVGVMRNFDLVVDKSTLDAMLCSDSGAALLLHGCINLKIHGTYLLISYHHPCFMLPLLRDGPLTFEVEEHLELERGDGKVVGFGGETRNAALYIYRLRKQDGLMVIDEKETRSGTGSGIVDSETSNNKPSITNEEAVRHHFAVSIDKWYRVNEPLVTPERERDIRAAFTAKIKRNTDLQDGCKAYTDDDRLRQEDDSMLTLSDVYEVILSEDERAVYSLELFLEDYEAFVDMQTNSIEAPYPTINAADTAKDAGAHVEATRMDVETAITFLTTMQ